jgi:hypothetical protein
MGGVNGLSFYSAGAKDEHIVLNATHLYDASRWDTVKGNWNLVIEGFWNFKCEASETRETHKVKNESHFANCNEHTFADKYEFIAGTTTELHFGDKHEFHQGKKFEETIGDSSEKVHGNVTADKMGNSTETVFGITQESFQGAKAETNLAAMYERTIGVKTEVMVGGKVEMTIALAAEITGGILYEKNKAVKKGDAVAEAKQAKIEKHEANLRIRKMQVELAKVNAKVVSLRTLVYKS